MAKTTGVAPRIRALKTRYPEMTGAAIARKVGCNPRNVYNVLGRWLGDNTDDDLRKYQESQADVFDSLAMRMLGSITPDKLEKGKLMELTTGAAILIDKARLVRGQATGINVTVLMDVVEAIRNRGQSAANPQPISAPSTLEGKP